MATNPSVIAELDAQKQRPLNVKKQFFHFFSRIEAQIDRAELKNKKRKRGKQLAGDYLREKDAIRSQGQMRSKKRPPSEVVDMNGMER